MKEDKGKKGEVEEKEKKNNKMNDKKAWIYNKLKKTQSRKEAKK